jgi:hypothetical protein
MRGLITIFVAVVLWAIEFAVIYSLWGVVLSHHFAVVAMVLTETFIFIAGKRYRLLFKS